MQRKAAITAVEYHLPKASLTNSDLEALQSNWRCEDILAKTGVACRHIAAADETASDLAYEAAKKLLASGAVQAGEIDLLILCTQTPDYALPTSACLLQDRLGLPRTCAAFDVNLGCSGFVYGLSIAKGFLESGLAGKALLLTGDTYSKWLAPDDMSVRTVFGDGAAATLVELKDSPDGREYLGPFVFGTDGSGWYRLAVHGSGARPFRPEDRALLPEGRQPGKLYMDGPNIFTFTIKEVPAAYEALMAKAGKSTADLDLVVFHQANTFMLDHLRKRIRIPVEKFALVLKEFGNTVSSSIPIALVESAKAGKLWDGATVALVGFGVGYSWCANLMIWTGSGSRSARSGGRHSS